MKILLYSWGEFNNRVLEKNLAEIGNTVISYSRKCNDYTKDMELAWEMIDLVNNENIEAVISFNYFPIISMICKTTGIPYYSWIFECPHHTLNSRTVTNTCNHIGCFDKKQVKYYEAMGIKTIRHIPLGVDTRLFYLNDRSYRCDVSFLGRLYTDQYAYYDNMDMPSGIRNSIDLLVKNQKFCYTEDYVDSFLNTINPGIISEILGNAGFLLNPDEFFDDDMLTFRTSVIERKISIEERRDLTDMLAGMDCDFRLYTGSDVSYNPQLAKCSKGHADYYRQMPSIFKHSKININNTLRSIGSGIPVRALDILACGGFLLSNYQPEIAEYFEENKEVVFYYSLDDLKEKIEFYLEHDKDRNNIALAGCVAVKERFDFRKQLKELLGD